MRYSRAARVFEIFLKYYKDDWIAAGHDIIFGPFVKSPCPIPDLEQKELINLGWHIDTSEGCWACFC